eukprot:m51a1_g9918 electron transfer flavoprotein subunit alpha (361) ;mRNA; r:147596-148836
MLAPRCLVLAELNRRRTGVSDTTPRLVTAAAALRGPSVDVLLLGAPGDSDALDAAARDAAALRDVTAVAVAAHPALAGRSPEAAAALLRVLLRRAEPKYTHLLAAAPATGVRAALPRVAGRLGVGCFSGVSAFAGPDTASRHLFSGSVVATARSLDPLLVANVKTVAFDSAPRSRSGPSAPVSRVGAEALEMLARELVDEGLPGGQPPRVVADAPGGADAAVGRQRPELASAEVVVSGGRGLKTADRFHAAERLADALGAAVGASRGAVDLGIATPDMQVGQTGVTVAPRLYFALGISGAAQHVAGMCDSGAIIAINTDARAPIYDVADYGLVSDAGAAAAELADALGAGSGPSQVKSAK